MITVASVCVFVLTGPWVSIRLSAHLIVKEADERANWWLSEGGFISLFSSPSSNIDRSGETPRVKQLIMVKAAETNW